MFYLLNFWRKSLRIQIASSFSILSLTIVALVGGLAFVQARETLKQSVFSRLDTASSLKEADLDRWLDDRSNTLRSINQLSEVNTQAEILLTVERTSNDYVAAQQSLQRLLGDFIGNNPSYEEFSIISKGGRVLASTEPTNVGWYASLNEYSDIGERSTSGKFHANVYQSTITGLPTITLTVAITNNQGKQLGILAVNLNLDSMDDIIRTNTGLGNTSETYLVTDIGSTFVNTHVFVSSDGFGSDEFPDGISSPGIETAMLGNQGGGLYANYRGRPVIGVYRWLSGQDMALVVEMTQAEAFAPAKQLSRSIFLVGLGLAALMTAGILGLSYQVVSPLVNIAETARSVRASLRRGQTAELETVKISADNEIGALAETFNQLVEQLSRSYEALHDKNLDLKTTLTDLKQTQTQLIQTEKMSSLGQMVAGIAHEINNPISFIQGNIKPLGEYFDDLIGLLEAYQAEHTSPSESLIEKQEEADLDFLLGDVQKLLGSLRLGTNRVRDIVVSLRNYSRLDEAAIKDVNLHEGLDSTLLILNHRIKHGVKVIKNYGELPSVRCSPAQLNQVFTNIIANALDAMFDADSSPKQLILSTCQLDATHLQISIRDTGPGMTPDIQAKIFDPFFTTKGVGKGTGLGMGICFKIVEQHQGIIEVISEVGQGTEFLITLPLETVSKDRLG